MDLVLKQLQASGLSVSNLTPDGKFRRDATDTGWYILHRLFSPRTGEEFHLAFFGTWEDVEPREFCTLPEVSSADKTIIAKNAKIAKRIYEKKREELALSVPDLMFQREIEIASQVVGTGFVPPVQEEGQKIAIFPLGFLEKTYYFTSTRNRQIVQVTSFCETDMFNLAPLEYWEMAFPGRGASRVDWALAKSTLMEQARMKGVFQTRHVRGAGAWKDENRIVVNMGDHLIVDGKRIELGALPSRYFYTLGSSLPVLHDKPLSVDECNPLIEACETFKWLKQDHSFLLAGALVVSRVCGALSVRPHVWITGGANTGKSTLLEQLIYPILGDSMLYVQGATSEAGIRQSLKADAIPVLFDEFETTGQKSAENVASVIELLRSAWSDSSALIVKGSAGGSATAYQVRCSAIVSSIRTKLTNDADRQRFAILELAPHGSDPVHWAKLSAILDVIDREYGDRLFARTIRMIPVLLSNFKALKRALAKTAGARFGDQYGMLLAGYSILLQDAVLTDSEALALASHVTLSEEREAASVADHDQALSHLLTKKVQIETIIGTGHSVQLARREFSVLEAIQTAAGDIRVNEALQRIGIRVLSGEGVAIATFHTELEAQVYRGTSWSGTWANSLSRLEGAIKGRNIRMSGRQAKCVIVPERFFRD